MKSETNPLQSKKELSDSNKNDLKSKASGGENQNHSKDLKRDKKTENAQPEILPEAKEKKTDIELARPTKSREKDIERTEEFPTKIRENKDIPKLNLDKAKPENQGQVFKRIIEKRHFY
jgi:hypothetical protein